MRAVSILLLALCMLWHSQLVIAGRRHQHSRTPSQPITSELDEDATPPINPLLLQTECGPAQGEWVAVGNDTNASRVAVWRSIPYAAPPVGDLRWAAPRDPTCWQGTYNATAFKDYCIQQTDSLGSEDCLYLHIYVPEELAQKNAERQLHLQQQRRAVELQSANSTRTRPAIQALPTRGAPIMFYIHGGGLMFGSGNFEPLAPFAAHARSAGGESVIVVSINYRLNIFGFLALRELSEVAGAQSVPAANFGIMDQQAALKWVQRNAARFGGDPTRVTLLGESSGATSIFAHYASPSSRDLFAGAIALSGSINVSMSIEQGHTQNAPMVAAMGCNSSQANVSAAAVVACLRAASPEDLLQAIPDSWSVPGMWGLESLSPGGLHYAGLLLVDGVTLTSSFGDALAAGLVDRPLIMGNCGQEADVAPDTDMSGWSIERFEDALAQALHGWGTQRAQQIAAAVRKTYERMDNGSLADAEHAFASFNADYGLTCGMVQLALGAKLGAFRSRLYTFVSQWAPSEPQMFGLHLARYAFHTSDYAAGIEDYATPPTARDLAQTALLQRAWATFMADGSLDALQGELGWEPFDAAPGFPAHWSTFVQRPGLNASRSEIDYKAGECALLAEYGFGPTFWWCD